MTNKEYAPSIDTLNLTEDGIMAFEEMDPYSTESGELVKKQKTGKDLLKKVKSLQIALGNGILSQDRGDSLYDRKKQLFDKHKNRVLANVKNYST